MELSLKSVFLLIIFFPTLIFAYPNGAVEGSCSTMIPGHGESPQTSFAPYRLTFTRTNYTGNDVFIVTLSKKENGMDFKGFMIQAHAPNDTTSLGTFMVNSSDIQTLTCTTAASAVSHTSSNPKSSVQAMWIPPNTNPSIQFRATVLPSFRIFWMDVSSNIIPLHSAGSQLMILPLFQLLICTLIYALLVK